MRIRTTYNGPTDTVGARIKVRLLGDTPGQLVNARTATYPYDYGAVRPHLAAATRFATEALEIAEPKLERIDGGVRRNGQLFEVLPGPLDGHPAGPCDDPDCEVV